MKTTDLPWLTQTQRDHLIAYARRHGAGWQEKLDDAWLSPAESEGPVLRGLRETHGREWLGRVLVQMTPLH